MAFQLVEQSKDRVEADPDLLERKMLVHIVIPVARQKRADDGSFCV
jgi:hypothetical protein